MKDRSGVVVGLAVSFAALIALLIVLADTSKLGALHYAYDFPFGDKVGHVVLYGTLTLLINLTLLQLRTEGRLKLILLANLAMTLFVSVEELSQLWVPARTPDWLDLASSYLGVAAGALAALPFWTRSREMGREPLP